ncbi:MAG: sugar phosphate isomerase/epimerase [Promethearchaeati archaeon SRVP18_Atabeyarchaeia-1]
MRIAVSTSCFLEKHEGYIIPTKIPAKVTSAYDLELQVDRGFTYESLADLKIKSIHLPFARYIPAVKSGRKVYLEGRTVNIANIDGKRWKRDLDYCKSVVRLSRGRGIENAILHYGNCTCSAEAYQNPHHRELHWEIELRFLKEVSKSLKAAGIRLLIENHPYQDRIFKSHSTHIQSIIDEKVGSLCFDLAHAFIRHKRFGDEEPAKLIDRFKGDIFEVHLADNDGETSEPLQLGIGKMPWQEFTKAINIEREEVLTVVELHREPMQSIDLLRTLSKGSPAIEK